MARIYILFKPFVYVEITDGVIARDYVDDAMWINDMHNDYKTDGIIRGNIHDKECEKE